ncbi:hypothetical protein BZA05DRAFT_405972 [Tricharina praecox]|uniref:uncharacterized protein n=1 Tax=Tricharina praecox TaxID=43433 RepID=UPI002220B49A|nr:uncharacterized protein BZA05DRAFT_405972 [Tricharina praecox]KAI5846956.1 hypothetical protein BZA05DRAFT_405972 [Tricharina praecox]
MPRTSFFFLSFYALFSSFLRMGDPKARRLDDEAASSKTSLSRLGKGGGWWWAVGGGQWWVVGSGCALGTLLYLSNKP